MQTQLFNFDDEIDDDDCNWYYGICACCFNRPSCRNYQEYEIPKDTSVCFVRSAHVCEDCTYLTNSDGERGMCLKYDRFEWCDTYACASVCVDGGK